MKNSPPVEGWRKFERIFDGVVCFRRNVGIVFLFRWCENGLCFCFGRMSERIGCYLYAVLTTPSFFCEKIHPSKGGELREALTWKDYHHLEK